jgi:hypothetical protein
MSALEFRVLSQMIYVSVSPQAEAHAVIKHRNGHIVMNHGCLSYGGVKLGISFAPAKILVISQSCNSEVYLQPILLPSLMVHPQQILHDSVLKTGLLRRQSEEFDCLIYPLFVESGGIFPSEGISQLISCIEPSRARILYSTEEALVKVSVRGHNLVAGGYRGRHNTCRSFV